MDFLSALLSSALQYVIMIGVVVGAVALGVTLRKKKNASEESGEKEA